MSRSCSCTRENCPSRWCASTGGCSHACSSGRARRSQSVLAGVNAPVDNFESHRFICVHRSLIIEPCIRCLLAEAHLQFWAHQERQTEARLREFPVGFWLRFHCLPAPLREYNFAAPSSIASNFLIRRPPNMKSSRVTSGMDRRHFLAATGGGLIAAAVPSAGDAAGFVTKTA